MIFIKSKAELPDYPHSSEQSSSVMDGKAFNGAAPIYTSRHYTLKFFRQGLLAVDKKRHHRFALFCIISENTSQCFTNSAKKMFSYLCKQ